jgi:hypothetical protein
MSSNLIAPAPPAYYSPETQLFPQLQQTFADTGQMHPEALYLILDWKASRARNKHLHRLATRCGGSFSDAVRKLSAELHAAADPRRRLAVLMSEWGFLLPTASAILAVLYPEAFTIYDRRVCEMLDDFHGLANASKCSDEVWEQYMRFTDAVRASSPPGLGLRDCDRWLWGQSKRRDLQKELASVST